MRNKVRAGGLLNLKRTPEKARVVTSGKRLVSANYHWWRDNSYTHECSGRACELWTSEARGLSSSYQPPPLLHEEHSSRGWVGARNNFKARSGGPLNLKRTQFSRGLQLLHEVTLAACSATRPSLRVRHTNIVMNSSREGTSISVYLRGILLTIQQNKYNY